MTQQELPELEKNVIAEMNIISFSSVICSGLADIQNFAYLGQYHPSKGKKQIIIKTAFTLENESEQGKASTHEHGNMYEYMSVRGEANSLDRRLFRTDAIRSWWISKVLPYLEVKPCYFH